VKSATATNGFVEPDFENRLHKSDFSKVAYFTPLREFFMEFDQKSESFPASIHRAETQQGRNPVVWELLLLDGVGKFPPFP
jgi:hypothetical protein